MYRSLGFKAQSFLTALILVLITLTGAVPGKAGLDRIRELEAREASRVEFAKHQEERNAPSTAEKLNGLLGELDERLSENSADSKYLNETKSKLAELDTEFDREFEATEWKDRSRLPE